MYSDFDSRTVNIVKDGKSETLITIPWGWKPWRLCCARSGDILVHVCEWNQYQMLSKYDSQRKNKIIRYQRQHIKQEINNERKGNPIFKDRDNSLFMSENNNRDVCVLHRGRGGQDGKSTVPI